MKNAINFVLELSIKPYGNSIEINVSIQTAGLNIGNRVMP